MRTSRSFAALVCAATSPVWQHSQCAGNVTAYRVKGVSKDNVFFGVQAVDNDGNVSVASYPLPLR